MLRVSTIALCAATAIVGLYSASATSAQANIISMNENVADFMAPHPSGYQRNVTFTSGDDSITLKLMFMTNDGEGFLQAATDWYVSVGDGTMMDSYYVNNDETVVFDVGYVSSSGDVDPNSIAFRYDSIGWKSTGSTTISWTVNNGVPVTYATGTTDASYSLDTAFTTIGTNTMVGSTSTSYRGVFDTSDDKGWISSLHEDDTDGGLAFSVKYAPLPEPTSLALLGLGGAALLSRKRRRAV